MQLSAEERVAESIGAVRRHVVPEFALSLIQAAGDEDFSLAQLATLYLLEGGGEHSVKQVASTIGRSLSATSRLLDQLARRGLIGREEDERDRRAKRVTIHEQGRALLRSLERRRADAQLALMAYLTPEERALVDQAMALLAEAARRRHDATHLEHSGT